MSYLSIAHRVQLLRAGLLSESAVRDLISEALARNLVHYLPKEVQQYGMQLYQKGKLKVPES